MKATFTRLTFLFLFFIPFYSFGQPAYAKLYWPNFEAGSLEQANLDGSGRQTIVANAGGPIAIEVDVPNGKIYWFNQEDASIYRANLDGSGAGVFVPNSGYATTLALDIVRGKLFWPNYEAKTLESINLDGTGRATVVATGGGPIAIALDKGNNRIYWFDQDNDAIYRANLDGTNTQVVIPGPGYASTIAIDAASTKLYWPNFDAHTIERSNLDGTGRETVVANIGLPNDGAISIALDNINQKIYYFNQQTLGIERANLDGTGKEPLINVAGYASTLVIPVKQTTLPVHLLSFNVKSAGCVAELYWSTGNALNFSKFVVERSVNGNAFTAIAEIPYAGSREDYHTTDPAGNNSNAVYRLKMVDNDGTFTYSQAVRAAFSCPVAKLMVYPNPATSALKISAGKKIKEIRVLTLTGQLLHRFAPAATEGGTITISLENIPAKGLYLCTVEAEDGTLQQARIIRQ